MLFGEYEGISFLHPMKTAMTSVESFIRLNVREYIGENKFMNFNSHRTPNEIMWRYEHPENVFDHYFCVMFARNPYDRLVSFYHHMRQIGGYAQGICKRLTFEELALYPLLTQVMRPMSDYITYQGRGIINVLGRFETLNNDVDQLINLIDFGQNAQKVKCRWESYGHAMKTEHDTYSTYYNAKTFFEVGNKYSEDFENFGYERA
jgi:hypothetical protein